MKDKLSVTLNLNDFFADRHGPPGPYPAEVRGPSVCRRGDLACAVIGRPRVGNCALAGEDPASEILALWAKLGTRMMTQVGGSYALAIVDGTNRQVFAATDRFASETLCFSLEKGILRLSDRADCCVPEDGGLDRQAIYDYLFFHMIPAPRTIFSAVKRIPAASAWLFSAGGNQEIRHWPLKFEEDRRMAFDAARNDFRGIVRSAVADQVSDHAQVGAFLSGGTDSSTVAGMLCDVLGKPAETYSIGFAAEGYDEMEYARLAARHFGCNHHEYYVTPQDLLTSIGDIARYHDQPFGNSSALPSYYCAKMARNDGCTRMLAGDGGDELFGGNSRYATQRVFEAYQSVPGALRGLVEPLCGDGSLLRKLPLARQATGYVRHSRIPMPDRLQSFNLFIRLDPTQVMTAEFLDGVEGDEPYRHMRSTWNACKDAAFINRMLAYDWRYTLADSDLPKVRAATAMAGIEVGYPLLDDRLVDFSMALEPEWKLRRLKLRWFFKEALRGFLPDEIITKKKHGFGLPYGPWMAKDPALRDLARDSLHGLVERRLVRAEFVDTLLNRHLGEHPGYYGEMVWIMMMLEQWLRGQEKSFSL